MPYALDNVALDPFQSMASWHQYYGLPFKCHIAGYSILEPSFTKSALTGQKNERGIVLNHDGRTTGVLRGVVASHPENLIETLEQDSRQAERVQDALWIEFGFEKQLLHTDGGSRHCLARQ